MKEKTPQEQTAANRQIELLSNAFDNAKGADGYWLNASGKLAPKIHGHGLSVSPFNALILALHSDAGGYPTNLYTTFPDARKRGDAILKGEKGVPFLYYRWDTYVNRHNPEDKISREDYKKLSLEQQSLYKGVRQREVRTLFNLAQSTMPMADVEGYRKLLDDSGNRNERGYLDKEDNSVRMSVNNFVLNIRDNLVPIRKSTTGESSYDIKKDAVYMPGQNTFASYPEYVQELMRKVVEATGHGERLARQPVMEAAMGTPKTLEAHTRYESLVQEMASAVKMTELGLPSKLKPETLELSDYWKEEFKSNPCLIDRLEADVNNALEVMRKAENGEKVEFASKRNADQTEEMKVKNRPQVSPSEALILQDILAHGGMSIDARNFSGDENERHEAKKAFMEKFANLDYYEGELLIALGNAEKYTREPNPEYPDLANVAYTVASGEASRIYEKCSEWLPKEWEQKGSFSIADEMMAIPDRKSKEMMVVSDKATGIVDVILPGGARFGGEVVMPNGDKRNFWLTPDEVMLAPERKEAGAKAVSHNIPGFNKEKISAALMAQGVTYVRFFNKEGLLRYRPDDGYFKDKDVYAAKLNGKELEETTRFDVKDAVRNATEQQFDRISMIKDDEGKWALLLKPQDGQSYAIYPDKEDQNRFFATIKSANAETSQAVRNELAQKYHAIASNHPELKTDLFYGNHPEGVDMDRIKTVNIFRTRDNKIMMSMKLDNNQHIPARELTAQQWQKLWVADNVSEYKANLAAVVYADILREDRREELVQKEEEKKEEEKTDGRKAAAAVAVISAHMLQQHASLKAKHPDSMLLLESNGKYLIIGDDAVRAHDILGLKYQKEQIGEKKERFVSILRSDLDTSLPKLVRAGERVAICEELQDPRKQTPEVTRGSTEDEAAHRTR